MIISWSAAAQFDVDRLYDFMAEVDRRHADMVLDRLSSAPEALIAFPRRGTRLSAFNPREIREYRVLGYVMQYELHRDQLTVLRIFHARENRT